MTSTLAQESPWWQPGVSHGYHMVTYGWLLGEVFRRVEALAAAFGRGGILIASRDNSVSPTSGGSSTLLLSVAAAVIGGTSLFGGKGRIIDAVIGGLVIGVIYNGLPLITQQAGIQFVVTAGVLLLAASVDAIARRRTAATGR